VRTQRTRHLGQQCLNTPAWAIIPCQIGVWLFETTRWPIADTSWWIDAVVVSPSPLCGWHSPSCNQRPRVR
jgi:hypothetical protein